MIKKPHKKRRRKAPMSASVTRRRRKHHKKGGLSDMFNPTIAMNSAKGTLLASGGGLLSMVVNKSILPPTAGKVAKIGTALIGGFVASAFGMQQIGAGFAGGMMALTFQNGLLADDNDMQETDFAEDTILSEQPLFLDENGNPMILSESDGEPYLRYLSEEEMAEYEGAQTYGV